MRWVRYWLCQSYWGIRSGWLFQIASIGTITAGLLLVGLALLGATNIDRLSNHWSKGFQITAYLKYDVSVEQVQNLTQMLEKHHAISSIKRVSSAQAFDHLEKSLGPHRDLLKGLEPDFLPASLELALNKHHPSHIRPILALLNTSPVIEEVDHMGAWLTRLKSVVLLLRAAGLGISIIVILTA